MRLSRLALVGERVWEALLWPFLVVCAFVVVSLLELWSVLPPLLHRVLLGGFGLALLISLVPLFRMNWPKRAEALRRLERKAEIKHRPASSYEDQLTHSSREETAAIWSLHRARLARIVAKLKPSWPEPRTDRLDPYAIRSALLLVLIVALLATRGSGWDLMRAAFAPGTSAAPALLRLDAWVTPPVYTGIAPIVLADGSEPVGAGLESFRALSVPERSELVVRAHSPSGESVGLVSTAEDGTKAQAVQPKAGAAEGLIEFSLNLTEPGTAAVKVGGNTVASWRFNLIEDAPPSIALMGNPTMTPRAALRLLYRANDDHGVASAEARFVLSDGKAESETSPAAPAEKPATGVEANPLSKPPVMPLQLPRANAKQVEGRATQDLTAHPWAGLPVLMTLVARDQAGQEGASESIEIVLPERRFTKPLARAVVEQRRKLVREPRSVDRVARALDALALGGERVIDDSAVYLGLRNAYWRLQTDRSLEGLGSVVDQLWHLALKIEEGDLPEAERAVREAQERLMQALKDNASPEEVQRLVEELRSALSRYLQSLAEQAQDKGNLSALDKQDGDQLVSQQDLDKMLQNIEDLAKSGSKDLAQRMLSELKDILDRLQTGTFADDAQQQRLSRMLRDLNDLVSDQQKLLDDTFGAKRELGDENEFKVSPPGVPMQFGEGMNMAPLFDAPEAQGTDRAMNSQSEHASPGGQGGGPQGPQQQSQSKQSPIGQLSERQGSLREQLQSLIDRLRIEGANPPQQFEDAGEAMGDAKEALDEEHLERAVQEQGLALDRLRKGSESLAQQMMEGSQAQAGKGQGNPGRDPLGRPDNRGNRPDLGLSVRVPDQIDIQKAREVLDELRSRLGDPSRPRIELDYLERLIRSF